MKIIKEFILREIAGECILVPTGKTSQEFNGMITLSDTARFIWENIERADSFEDLVKMMLEEYEIDEETAKNIEMLAKHFDDKMFIGAGTVLTESQVELTKKAGGKFIISPDTYPEVIKKTNSLDMVSIPGALTPSEIQEAHRCGADFVKLFPITSLGAEYVKAVKAPLSNISLLAVGGINENNIADYLKAGVCGFGVSSNIIDKTLLAKGDYAKITELAKKYTSAVK